MGWGDSRSALQSELVRPGYAHVIFPLLLLRGGGSLRVNSINFILNPTHKPF